MSGNVMLFGLGTFSSQVPSHPQQAWPATGGAPFLLSQHPCTFIPEKWKLEFTQQPAHKCSEQHWFQWQSTGNYPSVLQWVTN